MRICGSVRDGLPAAADLGIAFDGDGDRIALVDHEGMALTAEEATWGLLQTYGKELAGKRFVYDLKFSDRIPRPPANWGPSRCGSGADTVLSARMRESNALFGAEVSGHYFFRELAGGDDGLLAACRLLAYLARSGKTLADLRRRCPAVFITPDLRIEADQPSGSG